VLLSVPSVSIHGLFFWHCFLSTSIFKLSQLKMFYEGQKLFYPGLNTTLANYSLNNGALG